MRVSDRRHGKPAFLRQDDRRPRQVGRARVAHPPRSAAAAAQGNHPAGRPRPRGADDRHRRRHDRAVADRHPVRLRQPLGLVAKAIYDRARQRELRGLDPVRALSFNRAGAGYGEGDAHHRGSTDMVRAGQTADVAGPPQDGKRPAIEGARRICAARVRRPNGAHRTTPTVGVSRVAGGGGWCWCGDRADCIRDLGRTADLIYGKPMLRTCIYGSSTPLFTR